MTASVQKEDLQDNDLLTAPESRAPAPKPIGLPQLKHAKALFFRLDGREYAVPKMPMAAGTDAAEHKPRRPQKKSKKIAFGAKPAIKRNTA